MLLQALYEREPALHSHLHGVAALADEVGRALGLDDAALEELSRAAMLHDIGKIAIPDQILHKAGPLDEDEWRFVRQHTVVGERILGASLALRPIGRIVRATHERWDGTGYPDGLAGDEIPIEARIVFVCDAFEAMTGRPPVPAGARRGRSARGARALRRHPVRRPGRRRARDGGAAARRRPRRRLRGRRQLSPSTTKRSGHHGEDPAASHSR